MAEVSSASLAQPVHLDTAAQPSRGKAATFALLGAPNCGKTVLFNGLTGAHAKVANYAGVTVDRREGRFTSDREVRLIDLPGTYSLRTTSPDEAVARDVLLGKYGVCPDGIIAVADATNLRMTLRMMLELKTLGLPMVISLNLSDVARSRGLKIDAKKLSELLGATVLETVAISRSGVMAVEAAALALPRGHAAKLDPVEAERKLEALDSNALYEQVEDILAQVVQTELKLPPWHRTLDNIVMHPFWGMLVLLTILLLVFQAVYTWAQPVMDSIQGLFDSLGEWVGATLPQGLLSDLLVNGVIAVPAVCWCSCRRSPFSLPSSCCSKTRATCRVRPFCSTTCCRAPASREGPSSRCSPALPAPCRPSCRPAPSRIRASGWSPLPLRRCSPARPVCPSMH